MLLDCEHFFDGYKANPTYALACAKAAYDEGARWVVLCDTNGGTLPHEVEEIVGEVVQGDPGRPCRHPRAQRHRAGGGELARRGARRRAPDPGHAQRARRALRQRQSRLDHPDAEAQAGVSEKFEIGVSDDKLQDARARLAHARRDAQPRARTATRPMWARARSPPRPASMPRPSLKDPATYEHVAPETVGNRAQAPGLGSGRPLERARASWSASASRSTRTIRASRGCSTR